MPISDQARAALRAGETNRRAVHGYRIGGGQYVDVGILEVKIKSRPR